MISETSSQFVLSKPKETLGIAIERMFCYSMIFLFGQGVECSVVSGFLKVPLIGNEVIYDLSRFWKSEDENIVNVSM